MRGYWFDHNSGNCRFNRHYQNTGAAPFSDDWGKIIGKWIDDKIYLWAPYYTFVPDFAVNYYKYSAETTNRHSYMDAQTVRANASDVISVYLRDGSYSKQWGAFYKISGQLLPRLPESGPACKPDLTSSGDIFYYYSNPYQLVNGAIAPDAWGVLADQKITSSDGFIAYEDLEMNKMTIEALTHLFPPGGWIPYKVGDNLGGWLAPRVYVWVFYTANSYQSEDNPDPNIFTNPIEGNARDIILEIKARNELKRNVMQGRWILRDYTAPFAYSQAATGAYTRYGGIGDSINSSYVNIKNYVPATICGPDSRYGVTTNYTLGITNVFAMSDLTTTLPSNTSWTVLKPTIIELDDPNAYVNGAGWGNNITISGAI